MKIFLPTISYPYDSTYLFGVFSTQEKAQERIDEEVKKQGFEPAPGSFHPFIYEFELDVPVEIET